MTRVNDMVHFKTRFALAIAAAALSLAAMAAPASATANEAPIDVINGAVSELKAGLSGQRDALAADRAELFRFVDSLLAPRFDRNYAGRLVLARHWRDASNDQKRRFIDGLYNSLLRRYADGVLEFREDRIEILPERGEPDDKRATVRTLVTLDNGEQVPVNYGLVNRGENGWKVYDVTIEGISYVRNYRAEIDEEVKRSSLDEVIERLEREAEAALAGEDASPQDPAPEAATAQ